MKCRKCHKEMVFMANIQKFVERLIPADIERAQAMENQLILCEHCKQVYGYKARKGKLSLFTVTSRWLARQSKDTRANIQKTIVELKKGFERMKVSDYWKKRMEEIK